MTRRYDSRARRWRHVPPPPTSSYRQVVYTDDGILNFTTAPWPWMPEGRRRVAFCDGHAISDDELDLRLAAHEAARRSA